MATVHSTEKPFKCDFCSHSSGRKDKIREHIQSVHLKNRPKKSHKKVKPEETSKILGLPTQPIPRHDLVTLTPLASLVPSQFMYPQNPVVTALTHHPMI